ncbi:hypothetical protein Tco_0085020 [Tanacetum coccineum]
MRRSLLLQEDVVWSQKSRGNIPKVSGQGATYQRLVDKVFNHQIGRNLEDYMDDMVIKSTSEKEMVIQGAELNYPALEKLVLALVHAVIELGEHDIVFLRRNEKETPADFLVQIPFEDNEKKEKPKEVPDLNSKCRLYTDGASNSNGSGAGLMLIDPEGLRIAQEMEISKSDNILGLPTSVEHVRRNQNKKVDALSKLASMTFEHLIKEVLVEVLNKRSIEEKDVLKVDMQERKS